MYPNEIKSSYGLFVFEDEYLDDDEDSPTYEQYLPRYTLYINTEDPE